MIKLSYYRKKAGLSQIQLANKLNMSQQSISAYEVGKREPDINTLNIMADFFGITVDELLGKKESSLDKDYEFISFYENYKELEDDDKDILKAMFEAIKKKKKK